MDKDNKIIEAINKFNNKLLDEYGDIIHMEDEDLNRLIEGKIGKLIRIEPLGEGELEKFHREGGLVGVDGSVNKKGSAYPHYVEIYKGLAKYTSSKEVVEAVDLSSPLIAGTSSQASHNEKEEMALNDRNQKLAAIEMEVALEAAKRFKPSVLMLDGSLLRYHVYSKEAWTDLKDFCQAENILLIGVIEEVKTQIIGKHLKAAGNTEVYDREILFGKLNYGDMIIIDDKANTKREWTKGKIKESIDVSSAFLRSSTAPNFIGLDILASQREELARMGSLVLALTPRSSRGIPIWLDIIDREVKISNEMIEAYLKTYLDEDIYERYFVEIRSKR